MSRARPRALRCAMSERSRDRARAERREACDRGIVEADSETTGEDCREALTIELPLLPARGARLDQARAGERHAAGGCADRADGAAREGRIGGALVVPDSPARTRRAPCSGASGGTAPRRRRAGRASRPDRAGARRCPRCPPARPRARGGSARRSSHARSRHLRATRLRRCARAGRGDRSCCAARAASRRWPPAGRPRSRAAEQRRERAVQLVTEAPATAQGDLFDERDLVELDGHAEMDVEVLERHALEVRPVQPRERVRGGRRPAVDAQARQIRSGQIGAHGPPGYAASVPRTSAPKR